LSNHHLRRFLGLLTGGSSEFPGRVARSWHFPGVERPYVIEYSFTEFNVFGGKTVFPGTVAVSNSRQSRQRRLPDDLYLIRISTIPIPRSPGITIPSPIWMTLRFPRRPSFSYSTTITSGNSVPWWLVRLCFPCTVCCRFDCAPLFPAITLRPIAAQVLAGFSEAIAAS
jgi:hypothetical protein